MDKNISESAKNGKPLGIRPGQERFAFLYVVVGAAAVASAMIYSGIAGLTPGQTAFVLVGCVIVGWAALFSILEVRRLAQSDKDRAEEALKSVNPYTPRNVVVEGPTGDPYPHHEDYLQSAGFDQGQLTSRIPGSTPLIDKLRGRSAEKEQAAR